MRWTPRPCFSFIFSHFVLFIVPLGVLIFMVLTVYNFRYSGTLPDDSADAAPPEVELYEDLDFGDHSPIDYGYEDEEMSEGDIADD